MVEKRSPLTRADRPNKGCRPPGSRLARTRLRIGDDTAKAMADAGVWFVPTLAVTHAFSYLEAHGSPSYQVDKAREAAKYHTDGVARTIREGVRIAVGTDLLPSDPLDGTNATVREVELLVEPDAQRCKPLGRPP